MTELSRRQKIEKMLENDPQDVFLLYGLAMEYLREGNVEETLKRLAVVTETDANYHSAYFQGSQVLAGEGRTEEAKAWAVKGIEAAKRMGNSHAAAEMDAFLLSLS